MKFNDFNWDDIIMEAPEDNIEDTGEELTATDYTDAEGLDIEEGDPANEDNLDDEGDTTDNGDEDLNLDENNEDDLNLDDPEGDTTGDENPEDEQIDNENETENPSDKQNKYLIRDFIELHTRLEEILELLRTDRNVVLCGNPVFIKVRQNLDKLCEVTYDYIVNKFANNSYVANLYQFNLIIQAMNINVQMLESIKDLEIKLQEKKKKRKK